MPRWRRLLLLALLAAGAVPFALVARARATRSPRPRVHVIADMDVGLAYPPQAEAPLFLDRRAMRAPVPGAVARGELRDDPHLDLGQTNGAWASRLPPQVPVDDALLARGRERFELHCAVCHGISGHGDGVMQRRVDQLRKRGRVGLSGWAPVTNYHDPQVRAQPVGQLFNTISRGIRNMAPNESRITVRDRWAIAAYVKALQRSQDPQ